MDNVKKGGETMDMRTGDMAGRIWEALSRRGVLSLSELVEEEKEDAKVLLMALGWLLRENKIIIEEKEDGWNISLK